MTRCLKPLLEPRLLTFSRQEFASSTCRPRFFVFFFLRKPPVTSVRIINPMIEDTQRMKMMKKELHTFLTAVTVRIMRMRELTTHTEKIYFPLLKKRPCHTNTHVHTHIYMYIHFSLRLCPSTAGCSAPLMSSIVICLMLSYSRWFLLFYVVLPSSAWSSLWSLPSPWLPLQPCSTWSIYWPSFLVYAQSIAFCVCVCV